jgi:hypothetical protein
MIKGSVKVNTVTYTLIYAFRLNVHKIIHWLILMIKGSVKVNTVTYTLIYAFR